jgi:hypothetical protein
MHWLLALLFLPPAARTSVWCDSGALSVWTASRIVDVVGGDGAEAEHARMLYSLPRVSRDSVVRVTDERVCERASAAYYRDRLGPPPAGGVSVIRIRNRYVVSGANRAGEWTVATIYSTDFEPIVNLLM